MMRHLPGEPLMLVAAAIAVSLSPLAFASDVPTSTTAESEASSMATDRSLVMAFVHAWIPELRRDGESVDPFSRKLREIADLSYAGRTAETRQRLERLKQDSADPRLSLLLLFAGQQLDQGECRLHGGGRLGSSLTNLFVLKRALSPSQVPGQNPLAGMQASDVGVLPAASVYGALLSQFDQAAELRVGWLWIQDEGDVSKMAMNAWFEDYMGRALTAMGGLLGMFPDLPLETVREYAQNGDLKSILGLLLEYALQHADADGLLTPNENALIRDLFLGRLNAWAGDCGAARQHYKDGLELALAQSYPAMRDEFMVRLGDLELFPLDAPETMGFDPAILPWYRGHLEAGVIPPVLQLRSVDALSRAQAWYARIAEQYPTGIPGRLRCRLAFRAAYAASLQGQLQEALSHLEEARQLARDSGYPRGESLALLAHGLLAQEWAEAHEVLVNLSANRDLGGVLTAVEMIHAFGGQLWLGGDPWGAIQCLNCVPLAIGEPAYERVIAEPLITLARYHFSLGHFDAAIACAYEGAASVARFVEECRETVGALPDSPLAALDPTVNSIVPLEQMEQLRVLMMLSGMLVTAAGDEAVAGAGAGTFQTYLDSARSMLTHLIETAETHPAAQDPEEIAKHAEELRVSLRDAARTRETIARFRSFRPERREEVIEFVEKMAQEAPTPDDNGYLAWLYGMAGEFDQSYLEKARATFWERDPISRVKAICRAMTSPTASFADKSPTALGLADIHMNRAYMLEEYEALLDMSIEVEESLREEPIWPAVRPQTLLCKAKALTGLGRPDEALPMLYEALGASPPPGVLPASGFRLGVYETLVRAHVEAGSAVDGLLALERLWYEGQDAQRARVGLHPGMGPWTELQMLYRQSVIESKSAKAQGRLPKKEEDWREDRDRLLLALRDHRLSERLALQEFRTPPSVPQGVVALVYYLGDRSSVLWRLENDRVDMIPLATTRNEVWRLCADLLDKLCDPFTHEPGQTPYTDETAALYHRLVEPAAPFDEGAVLAFSGPHAEIAVLPYCLLGPDRGHMLLASNPTLFAQALRASPLQEKGQESRQRVALAIGVNAGGVQDLEAEARAVNGLLGGGTLLLGQDVTLEALTERIPCAGYIHWAAHGEFVPSNPYRSFLRMGNDKCLMAYQWPLLELDADLLFLSGCQTRATSGSLVASAGLDPQSAMFASFASGSGGARSIIASQWHAEERAASALITSFYEYLTADSTEGDIPHALWRARRDLVERAPAAHPSYWACFGLSVSDLGAAAPEL